MPSVLTRFFGWLLPPPAQAAQTATIDTNPPPATIAIEGHPPFELEAHMVRANDYPIVDWKAVTTWVAALPEPLQDEGWTACERGWMRHLRAALGSGFVLAEQGIAIVVSSLDAGAVAGTLDFMNRAPGRIAKVLDGIAEPHERGRELLIVFDDDDSYYRYVTHYYPENGEIAPSGGMHIDAGCGHYATVKAELRSVEPVIAHEMTHGALSHLPLPAWLNEGLAVNTEEHLTGAKPRLYTPLEMDEKHRAFWNSHTIQAFWSGEAFAYGKGDAQMLAYDLARIIVDQCAREDWNRFRAFTLAADRADAGAAAAVDHLNAELGAVAAALMQNDQSDGWAPDAARWPKFE